MNRTILPNLSKWLTLTLSLLLVMGICIQLKAQKSEKSGKIKIKVTTDKNGNSKTFEKEYDSQEEMLNDPDYIEFFGEDAADHTFLNFKNGKHSFNFNFDDEDIDGLKNFFNLDFHNSDKEGGQIFFFKSDSDDDDHFFKLDSSHKGSNFKFFFDEDGNSFDFDGESSFEELKEKLAELKEGLNEKNFFFHSGEGDLDSFLDKLQNLKDDESTRLIIIRKKVTIEDLTKEDSQLKKLGKRKSKALTLEDFNYYPNPSNGKFSLRFNMENEAPLSIKIYSLSGSEVYAESYDSFSGSFKSEIDLGKHDKGIYLLEIAQGNKVLNKKLILK